MAKKIKEAKYNPSQIANFFIFTSKAEKRNDLDLMKLLKLVYFAYTWELAEHGVEIFENNFQAWDYGPVLPPLYHELKGSNDNVSKYSKNIILGKDGQIEKESFLPDNIKQQDKAFYGVLLGIWEFYGNKTGKELSVITHENNAWKKAYKIVQNTLIDKNDMIESAKIGINKFFLQRNNNKSLDVR